MARDRGATVATLLIKAARPVLVGGRELPKRFEAVVALTVPTLWRRSS